MSAIAPLTGDELPAVHTPPPGPRSRDLAVRLRRVESRNITHVSGHRPIFWADARGAVVRDADDNDYVDLTAGFGVSMAGHANPRVAEAIAAQAGRLAQALGDVHPAAIKVELLETLARITPGDLSVAVLASTGAEAVEAAFKTASLRTGRPGILAFEHAYHGLTLGALATTWRTDFREPFRRQLFDGVRFAPFPVEDAVQDGIDTSHVLERIERLLDEAERSSTPVGAIIVEPIQGRGGLRAPAPGFLSGLRDLCDGATRVLIFDEVYSGFGRTGRWFACEHWDVVPDILVVGKALGGGVPISAAIGTPGVMAAWPPSTGEALHTSTFLGNPIACAAALAQIREIEARGLVTRAARLGESIRTWAAGSGSVTGIRGRGLFAAAVPAARPGMGPRERALAAADDALRRGVLVLAEGSDLDVLAIMPPAVISDAQLDSALDALGEALDADEQGSGTAGG